MRKDRRGKALSLSSALAIATALTVSAHDARAQSFQSHSTVVAGSAVVNTGTNTTTVTVGSPQAVINWTPFDTATSPGTPINFQPSGTTATFQSSSQFAVLNRILPSDASRPVQFNGAVISQIQNSAETTPGGTVYFFSPGGIIVGATAAFNVGNLGLTTSPISVDGNGNWYNSVSTPMSGNQVQFGQAASGSSVHIQPGAQITASAEGSYIAIFSPYIVQNGTINVNGQASLVAAEAGTLTFNPFSGSPTGLIDIEVSIGSDGQNGTGIVHGGTTTGPASSGTGDLHRVYMVAVPKSTLLSMVFERGSSVGFDVAGAANVQGNAVVLSAGQTLRGDAFKSASRVEGGSIAINDSNTGLAGTGIDFTSKVTAVATDNLTVDVLRQTKFASDALLVAEDLVQVAVGTIEGDPAGSLTVGGRLVLDTTFGLTTSASRDAGNATFFASDGAIATVISDMLVRSVSTTDRNGDGAATGGTAHVTLDGGQLTVGGELQLYAFGVTSSSATPLEARGGNAQILLKGASSATVGGVTGVRSDGVGRAAAVTGGFSGLIVEEGSQFTSNQLNVSADASGTEGGATATAGLATGGNALIAVSGVNSALTVQAANSVGNGNTGDLDLLSAEAFAGRTNAAGGSGGSAQGGNASFIVTGGAIANLPVNPGSLGGPRMLARAYGGNVVGNGGTGGTATGGIVSLNIDGATLNSGNNLLPSSFAQGGSAGTGATGTVNGGHAFGGQRNVSIINGTLNGSFAGGGPGAQGGDGSATGTGGNGTGGTANFFMDNATINATGDSSGVARVTAFTQNAGGIGMAGGNTSGGVVHVAIQNNSVINANGAGGVVGFNSFNFTLDATSAGAISTGDAAAGTVDVSVSNSVINTVQFGVFAYATSGSIATQSGAGTNALTGNAAGGSAILNLNGARINAANTFVEAIGLAGNSTDINAVNGGNATGGTAQIIAQGAASTINASGGLTISASAGGGTNSGPGNGGTGIGGFAHIMANTGGSLTINGNTALDAGGEGQVAQVQGRGGDGISGFSAVAGINGSLTFNGDLSVTADSKGGDGPTAGNASATVQLDRPNALLRAQNGGVTVTGATEVSANSVAGNGLLGGAGGNAVAGWAHVDAQNNATGPSTISLQDLSVSANGSGGSGGTGLPGAAGGAGGSGAGGNTQLFGNAANGTLTVAETSFLVAEAFGGSGGQGGANGGAGGAGGAANGGGIQFGTRSGNDIGSVNTGSATFAGVTASTSATGGAGGAGGIGTATGNGGAGGAATGGGTTLLVRGSPVRIQGRASLESDALGGNGGTGAVLGAGGSATVGVGGGAALTMTSRFQYPDQRGLLEAGDIVATAHAIGGTGSETGIGRVADAPLQLQVDRADVSLNSLRMSASGQRVAGAATSTVSIANVVANMTDTLSLSTPGDMSVVLDNSTVNVANLSLSAGNFVVSATRPTVMGTFNVSQTLQISSALNFAAYANFRGAINGSLNASGSFVTGDITSSGSVDIAAGGSINTGAINAANVILNSAQGVTTLGIDSDGAIRITAGGPVSVGSLTAGGTIAGAGKVAIGSTSGAITAGTIRSTGDLGIQTSGAITTGNLVGRDVLLLAGGSLTTGSITATGGAIYFSNVSAANSTNNVFQPFRSPSGMLPIFNTVPIAIGGSANFGGTVQGKNLWGAGQGTLSAQAISTSGFIDLVFGGLATVNGAWRSPRIDLVSGDIAITSAGSLDALSSSGEIMLATSNAAGVFIGDGVGSSTTGYVLDNAEFTRIRGGEIAIIGADTAQATDMTIGNLTVTGSQLYGADGALILATGNRETETPAGILRVAGAINATDFTSTTAIGFLSGTVEIEAVQGSVRVSDSSGGLGGIVFIEASNIHVASDEILTRLRADPRYQGVVADINRPLPVARPEGILNAAGLEIFPTNTLYVQNTGTSQVPAGFLTTFDNSELAVSGTPPTDGAQIVINGQFRTSTGTATGAAAFALVQADPTPDSEQFAGFSSNSQLNGCVFTTGACSTGAKDPVASISSTITVILATPLPAAPQAPPIAESTSSGDDSSEQDATTEEQEEESESAAASAPIAPPAPLINTRDLNPVVTVVEPVAGAGNPALLGSAVPDDAPTGENP